MLGTLLLGSSTLWLGVRLIFSLGIVLGLILGLSWVLRRGKGIGFGMGATRGAISVRAREQIGRNTTIALLEVGERVLLIGANEQALQVLAEGEDLLLPDDEPDASSDDATVSTDDRTSSQTDPFIRGKSVPPGMNMIEALREWSVRRA